MHSEWNPFISYRMCVCVCLYLDFLYYSHTKSNLLKQYSPPHYSQNGFSLWRWYTQPFSKAQSLTNWAFQQEPLLSSCFDQTLISPSFMLSVWYYVIISPLRRILHSTDVCPGCCFIHTAVPVLLSGMRVWTPSPFTGLTFVLTPRTFHALDLCICAEDQE